MDDDEHRHEGRTDDDLPGQQDDTGKEAGEAPEEPAKAAFNL